MLENARNYLYFSGNLLVLLSFDSIPTTTFQVALYCSNLLENSWQYKKLLVISLYEVSSYLPHCYSSYSWRYAGPCLQSPWRSSCHAGVMQVLACSLLEFRVVMLTMHVLISSRFMAFMQVIDCSLLEFWVIRYAYLPCLIFLACMQVHC